VNGWLPVDALHFEAAMVNAHGVASAFKGGIGQPGPLLPPVGDLLGTCGPVVQLAGLFGEAFGGQFPGGAQDVRVVVSGVAFLAGCVNGNVHGEPVALDQFAGEVMGQFPALVG
jgi:hypothetical protein